MIVMAAFALVVALTAGFYPILDQPKGEVSIATGAGDRVRIREQVKPFSEIEGSHYIKQAFDYSCGSAALATLLNFHLGEKFTENQVIMGLLQHGDSEQIAKRRAFSLLDMKRFVSALGYQAAGYKAEMEDLMTLTGPCIIPIKIFDYRHFAVLKGIHKGHVFLADPWRGDISFTVPEFREMWYENVIFVVTPRDGVELHALKLKEDDLRFIDEDDARKILSDRPLAHTLPEERRMNEVPKEHMFYKR